MSARNFWVVAAVAAGLSGGEVRSGEIAIHTYPKRPLIEQTRFGQALNFDFELTNRTGKDLELTAIRVAVRDSTGAIAQRLEVNNNGMSPGLLVVPQRTWKSGDGHIVFNPFHTLSRDIALGSLEYEFVFRDAAKQVVSFTHGFIPQPYRQKTRMVVPMEGTILVWDGHDFMSHHRRLDFAKPIAKTLGVTANADRYAFDFVIADKDGRFFTGDGSKPEDYYTYGHPVRATGDGIVVRAENSAPDKWDGDRATEAGNYIVIDHGQGEYSLMAHFKQGSVSVKPGDTVRAGQVVAAAGASGSSLFPHVHYEMASGPSFYQSEGLPVRFDKVRRILGARKQADTWIDSGDIIESLPVTAPRK